MKKCALKALSDSDFASDKETRIRPHPNGDFGMHSRDAYPQFADVWVH